MKFLKSFEETLYKKHRPSEMSREELLGHILHLYGSIPLYKQKSQTVLKKILYGKFPVFGEDVHLDHKNSHDKVRFVDYFDSLLNAKEVRGHNFEGFIAGLYDGELSKPGEKYDITIDGKTWSLKFVDNPSKAPEIGSFLAPIIENGLQATVKEKQGLTKIFQSKNNDLKKQLFDIVSKGITGGWLIAYPMKTKKEFYIQIHIIDLVDMENLLMQGYSTSPKGGLKSLYSLALSARYKTFEDVKNYKIIIPEISDDELREIYISDNEEIWGTEVFGKKTYKIRPDVLKYIKKNSKDIGKKLMDFEEPTKFDDLPF